MEKSEQLDTIWELPDDPGEEIKAIDTATGNAPMGELMGRNPTDRGKAGTKRSLLVETEGGPLSVVVAGVSLRHMILPVRAAVAGQSQES